MTTAHKDSIIFQKRCLVVGATGFIGQHLVRALLSQGADVTAVGYQDHKIAEKPNCRYKQADLTYLDSLKPLSETAYDYIFNLSGYIDHTSFFDGGRKAINHHYTGL